MNYRPDNFFHYAKTLRLSPPPPRRPTTREQRRLRALPDPERDQIVELINESGLSDSQIAKECSLSPRTIADWRAGRIARPRHMSLALVLAALGKRFLIVNV
jgi:DNA-binding transcriptional regulator YiaG